MPLNKKESLLCHIKCPVTSNYAAPVNIGLDQDSQPHMEMRLFFSTKVLRENAFVRKALICVQRGTAIFQPVNVM